MTSYRLMGRSLLTSYTVTMIGKGLKNILQIVVVVVVVFVVQRVSASKPQL